MGYSRKLLEEFVLGGANDWFETTNGADINQRNSVRKMKENKWWMTTNIKGV